jgi:hypothetical protein
MSDKLPVTRVVLYKHGIGYFEREGRVDGDSVLSLTFKQREVADVLKSLTVLDLNGGQVTSVSYDSTRPLEQLLQEVDLNIPDQNSLVGLLPQLKGARLSLETSTAQVEGVLIGIDTVEERSGDAVVHKPRLSVLTDEGVVSGFDLVSLSRLEILDPKLRDDLEFYLRTLLSARKKDARTFSFFASGKGARTIRMSYTLEAPVWKATYRLLLGTEGEKPMIQGWAVVDNTQDEDWEDVQLSLVSGLPVSFVHDLYTPRYIKRPVVAVQETTGVLPPMVEDSIPMALASPTVEAMKSYAEIQTEGGLTLGATRSGGGGAGGRGRAMRMEASSTPAQVRERKLGDLFEYAIDHAVTIRRNQSALVPIVLRPFEGKPVLLYNRDSRKDNPLRAVEFHNTTGLTLEGGPVTVLEAGSYVGEAMLDTLKPDEERLVAYAVELSVKVTDTVKSHKQQVARVILRDGLLTIRRWQAQTTTYTLDNRAGQEYTLYLEHPRQLSAWELLEPTTPHATTENFWRFKITLPAKSAVEFVVKTQLPVEQQRSLRDLSPSDFAFWIDQKYLDAPTRDLLRRINEVQGRIGTLGRQVEELEAERETIHQEQTRIRENLQALGDRSSEKDYRERLVRTLNDQEDRLGAIGDGLRAHKDETARLVEERNGLIGQLDTEAVAG